jgi:hypothetical protein
LLRFAVWVNGGEEEACVVHTPRRTRVRVRGLRQLDGAELRDSSLLMEIGARGGSAFVTCLEVPSVVHEERVSRVESFILSFYSSSLQLQLRIILLRARRCPLLLLSDVSCRVEDLVAILLGCSICSPSTTSSGALSSWLRTALRGCGRGRPCYMLHATGNGNGNRVQPQGRFRVGF